MDWKYKHFNQEAVFKSSRESVLEAARTVVAEALPQIENTPDGFVARGHSAWHAATATFRIEPTPDGAKIAVELLVGRAGGRGFMLVDIGGYYDSQIRKWLLGVSRHLGQQPISMTKPSLNQGCLTGCVVYLIAGAGLALLAMPLDRVAFPQSSSAILGPFMVTASLIGFLAGVVAFLYVMYPEASIWSSIRERQQRIQNKERQ